MGNCTCLGSSQVEQYLTDFIDELKIRNFTDKKFSDFIERNNPFSQTHSKLGDLLASSQLSNSSEHQKYANDLLASPRQYLCVALLFLTRSSPKTLSGQYLILVDRLKNKFIQISPNLKLEDFYHSDFEVLRTALLFYCRMISFDVVNSCEKSDKVRLTPEQINQLKTIYSAAVIENYVYDQLLKNFESNNFNHEDFFKANHQNLQHQFIRERLRAIWTSKYSPVFQKDTFVNLKSNTLISDKEKNEKIKNEATGTVTSLYSNVGIVNVNNSLSVENQALPLTSASQSSYYMEKITSNPMNATVHIPSFKSNEVKKVVDLTDSNSSLGLVAAENRLEYNASRQEIPTYQKYYFSEMNRNYNNNYYVFPGASTNDSAKEKERSYEPQKYEPTKNISESLDSSNLNTQSNMKISLDLPSLVASGRPSEISSAYIDPYNNSSNKFLYGKEKIEASDIKNLSTKLFLTLKQFRKETLHLHNESRKLHQVSELIEDPLLTERAQEWANSLAETDSLKHSDLVWNGKLIGENIAKGSAVLEDPSKLVFSKWYMEIVNYDFAAATAQPSTKNFTQVVWKETKQIGMGLAYSKNGNTYVVVNYFPAGNDENKLRENVLPANTESN